MKLGKTRVQRLHRLFFVYSSWNPLKVVGGFFFCESKRKIARNWHHPPAEDDRRRCWRCWRCWRCSGRPLREASEERATRIWPSCSLFFFLFFFWLFSPAFLPSIVSFFFAMVGSARHRRRWRSVADAGRNRRPRHATPRRGRIPYRNVATRFSPRFPLVFVRWDLVSPLGLASSFRLLPSFFFTIDRT